MAISASHTRLYQGSRWDFTEVAGLHLPQGVAKVESMTEYEETDYANPVGRRGGLAKAQSFGDDPDQIRKEELLELLHRIAPNASRRNAGSATARNGAPDARVASAWSSDGTDAIAAGTREMPE